MIVYLSSYPRSGQSLLNQIISHRFERPSSGVSQRDKLIQSEFTTNWRLPRTQEGLVDKINRRLLQRVNLDKWIARYDLKVPPYTKDCCCLLPGCHKMLTPKNRRLLAAKEDYLFLKSHYGPEVKYFNGEYIIQIVRHPGVVFTSYQRFLSRVRNRTTTLDQVICGSGPFGSWSQWHQQWNLRAEKLPGQFLRLRYEDVLNDVSKACDQIKALVHLDYNPDNPLPTFEELHIQNPNYFHRGKSAGWEECYTSEELELLLRHHSKMMEKLGYAVTLRLTH